MKKHNNEKLKKFWNNVNVKNENIKRNIKSIMCIFGEIWDDRCNVKSSTSHAVQIEWWDNKNEFLEIKKIWWLKCKVL